MSIKKLLAYLLIVAVILLGVYLIITTLLPAEQKCNSRDSDNYMKLVRKDMGWFVSYSIHYYDHVDNFIRVHPDIPEFDIEMWLTDLHNQGRINDVQYDCGIDQIG